MTSHIPTLPSHILTLPHKEKPDRSSGIECAIMEIKQFTLKRLKRSLDQMEETENLNIYQPRISSLRKRKKECRKRNLYTTSETCRTPSSIPTDYNDNH